MQHHEKNLYLCLHEVTTSTFLFVSKGLLLTLRDVCIYVLLLAGAYTPVVWLALILELHLATLCSLCMF